MPLNATGNTSPVKVYEMTLDHINSHINQRVVDYFQDRADYLRFVPKKASTIRIIGRRKVRPDMRYHSSIAPGVDALDNDIGTIPDYQTSIYWPMNRKLHLEKSNEFNTGKGNEAYFPNYSWLPFCILYDRDWDQRPSEDRPKHAPLVAYNDAIYYTDS